MTTRIQAFACLEKTGVLEVPRGTSIMSVGTHMTVPLIFGMIDDSVTETSRLRYVIAVAGDNLDELVIGGLGFIGSVMIPELAPLTYHVYLEMK